MNARASPGVSKDDHGVKDLNQAEQPAESAECCEFLAVEDRSVQPQDTRNAARALAALTHRQGHRRCANGRFTSPAVESVPGRRSGAWVFRGTRMPVSAVFENLQDMGL